MIKIKIIIILFGTIITFYAPKVLAGNIQISFPDTTKLQPIPLYIDPNISGNVNWPNVASTTSPDQATSTTSGNTEPNTQNSGNNLPSSNQSSPSTTNGGVSNPNTTTNATAGQASTSDGGSGNLGNSNNNPSSNPTNVGWPTGDPNYISGTNNLDQSMQNTNITNGNDISFDQHLLDPDKNDDGTSIDSRAENKAKLVSNYVWPMIYLLGIIAIATTLFIFFKSKNK